MAPPTQWTWVQESSQSWWWTGKLGVLQSMGLQRVGQDWVTELTETTKVSYSKSQVEIFPLKSRSRKKGHYHHYYLKLLMQLVHRISSNINILKEKAVFFWWYFILLSKVNHLKTQKTRRNMCIWWLIYSYIETEIQLKSISEEFLLTGEMSYV